MDKKKQKIFVNALINNVRLEILRKAKKFPDDWDGIEIRQFIADSFAGCVIKDTMSKKRKKEYNNFIIVNNL